MWVVEFNIFNKDVMGKNLIKLEVTPLQHWASLFNEFSGNVSGQDESCDVLECLW